MATTIDTSTQRSFTPVQWATLAGCLMLLFWSVPGMIINPDFGVGDSGSYEYVMGVDMNGWHALSGLLVAIPGLLVVTRSQLAAWFNLAAAAGIFAVGVWLLFTNSVAGGLLLLPHTTSDALLHFATSAVFVAGALHYFATERAR